jgi:hypothetical protein
MLLRIKNRTPKPAAWYLVLILGFCAALGSGCGPAQPDTTANKTAAATNKPPAKSTATAKTQTNATPDKVELPKSVFVDDLKQGVDPFFPKSNRRQPKTAAGPKQVAAQPTDPFLEITLNGILGSSRRRIATINNRPFEAGETGEITLASGKRVLVKCLKINETSVEVVLEGQPERKKTISLRKEL